MEVREHDRRHPTRKKNWQEVQSGQLWKAAERNPVYRGDVTYKSLLGAIVKNRRLRIEMDVAAEQNVARLDALVKRVAFRPALSRRPSTCRPVKVSDFSRKT